MTFSVQNLSPVVTVTVQDYDGPRETTLTCGVYGYVQGTRKCFALCEDSAQAYAIQGLLQAAENAKTVL